MGESTAAKNEGIVLEAFETLFNKRDYAAAKRYWSPDYVPTQRSYRTWPRGSFQSHQEHPADVEVRAGNDCGWRETSCSCTGDFRDSVSP